MESPDEVPWNGPGEEGELPLSDVTDLAFVQSELSLVETEMCLQELELEILKRQRIFVVVEREDVGCQTEGNEPEVGTKLAPDCLESVKESVQIQCDLESEGRNDSPKFKCPRPPRKVRVSLEARLRRQLAKARNDPNTKFA
jgi:hypothetical protein